MSLTLTSLSILPQIFCTTKNLIGNVLTEMNEMSKKGTDCWLTRVNSIEKNFKIPTNFKYSKFSGKKITTILRGKFDSFWLKKINEFKKNDADDLDHNKLRVYKTFKSCFAVEPYVACVRNRNQRSALTRLRISAHSLATEILRRTQPITPYNKRFCVFCQTIQNNTQTNLTTNNQCIDTEKHFLLGCETFKNTRNSFLAKMSVLRPGFENLPCSDKFAALMCPVTPQQTMVTNRYIKFMVDKREKILQGEQVESF